MRYLILLVIFSGSLMASDYSLELDAGHNKIEHAWRGPNNYAQFEADLNSIGLTAWRDNVGLRLAYIKGDDMNTLGIYEQITIKLKHIISLELLYKYQITNNIRVYAGIGANLIPVPMHWDGIDPTSHAATDADNDEGYLIGAQYRVSNKLSVGWRFTHYSRIKEAPYDEWIKGHGIYLSYKF